MQHAYATALGQTKNQVIELAHELEATRIVSSTPRDAFASADALKALCDRWNQAAEIAAENGLELGLHNHWWEFQEVDGRPGFEHLVDALDESIFFQVDTYWVNTGGGDSVQVVETLGERAPLLHIKDGPCDPAQDMLAVGEGAMDFPPIIEASHDACDWLIVELDRCATDMMEAVEKAINTSLATSWRAAPDNAKGASWQRKQLWFGAAGRGMSPSSASIFSRPF